ncbi:MAG TPA: peptidoglycan bridge formation glycyltransferase FemA/FemB family protein [Levilinea sp.]|nr:peptidoglycan bridge formation glycyltransferase FemA/FemB family protein [Levilinea sp.]
MEVSKVEMNAARWNEIVAGLPGSHILQTWEWGQVKAAYGWQAQHLVWDDTHGSPQAAGLILTRALPLPGISRYLRMMYVPRGPLLDWNDLALRRRVLDDLQSMAKRQAAIFIKIDPEVPLGTGLPGAQEDMTDATGASVQADLLGRGWMYSEGQIQFRNTVWVDLQQPEDTLLARMKSKTRYNIRLAERKGVTVREVASGELPVLYRMYAETSLRDSFVIRPEDYYLLVWRSFMEQGKAVPLVAEVEGQPVAGLVLFMYAGKAWYLYGMSTSQHREKMPNHLLQWEAMRLARQRGCAAYDLWGAPEVFDESDSMWGVFRFKEGLGGRVIRTIGAWDFLSGRQRYNLFMRLLPRVLDVMRFRRRAETRREVSA